MNNYRGIDHSKLWRRIHQRLENVDQPQITLSLRCIYRTPKLLRKVNEAAYTPRLVSIGPFHYGNEVLQMMEKVKNRFLRDYLDRTQRAPGDLLYYMEKSKEELKSYYAEVTLSDTDFVEIILLDGVFIIELFLRMFYPDLVESSDVILLQSIDLKNDLFFMLENQLPWFFIEELYNKHVIQHVPDHKPFLDIALSICSNLIPSYDPDIDKIRQLGVKHLHDLLRTTIIHPLSPIRYRRSTWKIQRLSATVLHEAGVKFKVRGSKSFLDIMFNEGKLYIPRFIFDCNTETFARNLMAYEQCHYQDYTSHTYLRDYFYLMDILINTSEDVDLLVKSGIIINELGDNDEMVAIVNNLFKHVQIGVNQFYYTKLCKELNEHCNIRWNQLKSTIKRDYLNTLKRDYLNTPWKVASTIAAIILLLLTLIQTVYSVMK